MTLLVGSSSHIGKRSRNEDTVKTDVLPGGHRAVILVADGMGGHPRGDEASQLAARIAIRDWHLLDTIPKVRQRMKEADDAVTCLNCSATPEARRAAINNTYRHGPGSTLTAVYIHGNTAIIGHIGDCRAYGYQPGKQGEQLTRDHGYGRFLDRALGNWDLSHVRTAYPSWEILRDKNRSPYDVFTWELSPGGAILACSDGVHGAVDRILKEPFGQDCADLSQRAEEIATGAVVDHGASDNSTVAIVYLSQSRSQTLPRRPHLGMSEKSRTGQWHDR